MKPLETLLMVTALASCAAHQRPQEHREPSKTNGSYELQISFPNVQTAESYARERKLDRYAIYNRHAELIGIYAEGVFFNPDGTRTGSVEAIGLDEEKEILHKAKDLSDGNSKDGVKHLWPGYAAIKE